MYKPGTPQPAIQFINVEYSVYDFSVLKDMVRDLEQRKENEEKHSKTTTEKNGHLCCNEHSEFLENHPNKMCHRSDGGCTCYYCTIFGHTVNDSPFDNFRLKKSHFISHFQRNAIMVGPMKLVIDCESDCISNIAKIRRRRPRPRTLKM